MSPTDQAELLKETGKSHLYSSVLFQSWNIYALICFSMTEEKPLFTSCELCPGNDTASGDFRSLCYLNLILAPLKKC